MLRDNADMLWRLRRQKPHKDDFDLNYPTVYQVDEFEAAENARTIRQIINGQAAYYGLLAETEPTPDEFDKGANARRLKDDLLVARLRSAWQRLKAE